MFKSFTVRRGLSGCGEAQRVQRGSDSSTSACCKAGLSSNLGGGPLPSGSNEENRSGTLRVVHINIVCVIEIKKSGSVPPNPKKIINKFHCMSLT
jgi:hypothetical protein